MSDRLSLGPIQVTGLSVFEMNDALRQICDRIDSLKGLRGRGMIFDRVRVDDPTVNSDAMTLGTFLDESSGFFATVAPPEVADASASGTSTSKLARADHTHKGVSITTTQTVSGAKTFTATVTASGATSGFRYLDANSTLLHSFGPGV